MGIEFIGILVLMGVAMYFLMIRPARKQQQKQQEMMNSLDVGSRVMLTSGIYGTIRHMGDRQAVIEISPGVDLTILRAAIRGVVAEDEEDFEYSDETAASSDERPSDDLGSMSAYEADVASGFSPEANQADDFVSGGVTEPAEADPADAGSTDAPTKDSTGAVEDQASPETDDSGNSRK